MNGKVIVRRHPRLDDTIEPGRGEIIAIRTTPFDRETLMAMDPETFFLTEHWAKSRNISVLVRLAKVSPAQLRELVTDAWRARATKRQVSE